MRTFLVLLLLCLCGCRDACTVKTEGKVKTYTVSTREGMRMRVNGRLIDADE